MGSREKNRVIVETVQAGRSLGQTAQQYGVSKVWVHTLVQRFRAGGWEALEPRSKRPLHPANQTSSILQERIIALRHELTTLGLDAGAATIREYLLRDNHTAPAVSTIWRMLTRAGLVTPQPRKRPRSSYTRFQADLPNECWQADFTHWPLADGTDTNILLWVDDHSRYLLSATAHPVVTGPIVLATFRHTCATHGIPASTLTDNGFVFTTRHRHGPNRFEAELAHLGVTQKNGTPNHPQTQGKVERLNQTLKRWLTAHPPADDLAALQAHIDKFTRHYNTIRPHRSLTGRTPEQVYTARAKATPGTPTTHWRRRTDKISKGGNVTLRIHSRLHHIGLGKARAGTPVELLVHDLDVIIIDNTTGQIIRELTINTDTDYQPLGIKPGPPKGTPRPPPNNPKT
ncbi:IS481 family transposase [Tessaracoccus sp. SD287]|uniref:IS481 family transposase n=1 Tax=Tessaracoccus sp. SD287 TaxID=2782008 RepID=UPI001DA31D24|nr:IS481 family transposase [Tessaracoccus sp. SD287]MBO1031340.1 IS481 family transposase [Tessaracoccus sp. SD287]